MSERLLDKLYIGIDLKEESAMLSLSLIHISEPTRH